jgi:hypothetical protein
MHVTNVVQKKSHNRFFTKKSLGAPLEIFSDLVIINDAKNFRADLSITIMFCLQFLMSTNLFRSIS